MRRRRVDSAILPVSLTTVAVSALPRSQVFFVDESLFLGRQDPEPIRFSCEFLGHQILQVNIAQPCNLPYESLRALMLQELLTCQLLHRS